MPPPIISVDRLSKRYRLGVIGATTLRESFERWWHKARGRDPAAEMGVVGVGHRMADETEDHAPAADRRQSNSSKSLQSSVSSLPPRVFSLIFSLTS